MKKFLLLLFIVAGVAAAFYFTKDKPVGNVIESQAQATDVTIKDSVKDGTHAVVNAATNVAIKVKDASVNVATNVKTASVDAAGKIKDSSVKIAGKVKDTSIKVATDVRNFATNAAAQTVQVTTNVIGDLKQQFH